MADVQQAAATMNVKEQVVDTVPKRIKELRFGLPSSQDIVNQSVLEVCHRDFFDLERDRAPQAHGPLDPRMGISSKHGRCETCGEAVLTCNGHFGVIKLVLPAFHIGYFKTTITICQNICKDCARILLPVAERRKYLQSLRRPNLDNFQRLKICKKINDECRKTKKCYACGAINGQVKKGGPHPLKLLHDRFSTFKKSKALKKEPPKAKIQFEESFSKVKDAFYGDVNRHLHKAVDDLNPLRVLNLFKQITSSDVELLGMDPLEGRPESLLWQCVPAPPVCIRPSVPNDTSTTEDDLTQKVADIANINNLLKEGLKNGLPIQTIMEQWEYMQTLIALYINGDQPGLVSMGNAQHIRGLCQRLKGKQGRFRGNLSGKRVDFSGRTVISPDPNLAINEVAIPVLVAKRMTYPETVSRTNKEKLQQRVLNGLDKWPGANYISKPKHNIRTYLKYGKPSAHAENLQFGDVVERHLEDGDIVLFNRQPSLHKLSILSHFVKVRPHRTFSLNECVCNPYNADFDGDEMNLHVPQSEEARAEALELMGVKHNLCTPKNGEPIISAIQDFITAAYLLSSKNVFYDRKSFTNICMYMVDGNMKLDLPPPTVLKPEMLWTGKQVFNVMMRPNNDSPVKVNLDAACREYRKADGLRDLDVNDGWLCVRNSEIMCGVMDKSTIGSGKKDSIFYVILRDYGPDAAVQAMNRMAKLSARWLTNQGFSIGINDVYPGGKLTEMKEKLVETAYAQCDAVIESFKHGNIQKKAGCDEEETMESEVSGILNRVRQAAGNVCITELSRWNSPLIMATSGSKGSNINVSQMVAVVGQQIIGGKRVADGFEDRSLPHFAKNARHPPSKGFVKNSFFSGLHPTEFIFHAISGREGLVDTAVKTAETGYMSRRLMKSLEDLSTQYDNTVRNGTSHIVQFQYGDDKLDPVDMEAKAKPVHFDRTYTHAESTTWDNSARTLLPYEIIAIGKDALSQDRQRLLRQPLVKDQIDQIDIDANERPIGETDELDSVRDYLCTIELFIHQKAEAVAASRKKLGLTEGLGKDEKGGLRGTKAKAANEALDRVAKIPEATLRTFVHACLQKYEKALTEPGHAVGAVAAQSIGEPGTQMTLKTFHFAGVAGMSITQGVPRIKEIINASKEIQTPVISCELLDPYDLRAARIVKGRIEKTYLKDIASSIEVVWLRDQGYVWVKIDFITIEKLQLNLSLFNIRTAILKYRKLKLKPQHIRLVKDSLTIDCLATGKPVKGKSTAAKEDTELFLRMEQIRRTLPNVPLSGHERANRAIINTDDNCRNTLLVEGYGLRACMSTAGVRGTATRTNSIMEMKDVLGIEAARTTIIDEISVVMGDMDIDPRHMQLLADVMTYKGEILGITRFGMAKMRDSVLQLASFEKTPDHLFEAAWMMKRDKIEGVSECIIMGQSIGLGTGGFQVVRELALREGEVGRKKTVFEDAWNDKTNSEPGKK